MKKKKVTPSSLGLVNRRMLVTGVIATLAMSFILLLMFFGKIMKHVDVGLGELFALAMLFAIGIAHPLIAVLFSYRCFTTLNDVMKWVCGGTQFDYRNADVFLVHETYLLGSLGEHNDNWFCTCLCSVYRAKTFDKPHNEELAKRGVRYYTHSSRVKVMFCFPSRNAMDRFIKDCEEGHKFWRNDGNGNLEKCECPQFANARIA